MCGKKLRLFIFVICALFTFGSQQLNDEVSSRMETGLRNYIHTGQRSPDFQILLESLKMHNVFKRNTNRIDIIDGITCFGCQTAIASLLKSRRTFGAKRDTIADVLKTLCSFLKIKSEKVCTGVIESHIDIILYIVDHRPNLNAKRICSIILQNIGCESPPGYDWSIEIPPGHSEPQIQVNSSSSVKIAHLTDFHYDPLYSPDSNAECDDVLCCSTSQGEPANEKAKAGYWGDYRDCDSPWHAITDALNHISTNHPDLSYVYYTGDIVSHRVWETSGIKNRIAISSLHVQLKQTFGSIPVYPILGNHEAHPVNIYAPLNVTDSLSSQWLFDYATEEWARWLPPETNETIRMGGYYTVLVKPGFRIIALNSNVCYIYNWWIMYDAVDPYGQLKWLVETLLLAENNSEMVHILSHIPSPDDTCHKTWSREYRRIIERFSHIIKGQFNGHTHDVELFVYYNKSNPTQAINIAWNGGSLTPFTYLNPNYIIYYADSENMEITDYDLWTYNLGEANQRPNSPPEWYKMPSFKDFFELQSLSLDNMADLMMKMASRKKEYVLAGYYSNKVRATLFRPCTGDCLLTHLCRTVTSEFGDRTQCDIMTKIWKDSRST